MKTKCGRNVLFPPLHRRSRAGALFSPQARFRQSTLDPVEVSQQLQRHLEKNNKKQHDNRDIVTQYSGRSGLAIRRTSVPSAFSVTKRGSSSLWRLFMGLQESLSALGDVTKGTASPTNSLPKKKKSQNVINPTSS